MCSQCHSSFLCFFPRGAAAVAAASAAGFARRLSSFFLLIVMSFLTPQSLLPRPRAHRILCQSSSTRSCSPRRPRTSRRPRLPSSRPLPSSLSSSSFLCGVVDSHPFLLLLFAISSSSSSCWSTTMVPYVMFPQYRVYVRYKKEVSSSRYPKLLLYAVNTRIVFGGGGGGKHRGEDATVCGVVVSCACVFFVSSHRVQVVFGVVENPTPRKGGV